MTPGTFEDLASKYAFHFVGDSTTRRLTESFISILTGVAAGHDFYHETRNLSIGGLKVPQRTATAYFSLLGRVS